MRKYIGVIVAGALAASACVSNENRTPTISTAGAGDFLGYSDAANHQTVCGNCHIDRQRQWQATAHARAWADLQNSGHAQSSCNRCHTVNGTSNLAPDSSGYFSVNAAAKPLFTDVQCESCHGPGGHHIQAPDQTQPLTTIAADTGAKAGCGTCHSGVHTPFVEEWKQSLHAVVQPAAVGNTTCAGCHDGRTALRRFKPEAHFIEEDSTQWQPITCAVCHEPHGSDNPAQLRLSISDPSLETNLCMQCHFRRSNPDPTNAHGLTPHSPEGPMLLGDAGWRPSTFTYDSTQGASSHGTTANPRLCAGCHVHAFSATDKLTGQQIVTTGHRFRPIPCLTTGGAPDTTDTCTLDQRSFASCTASGCHGTESAARNAFTTETGRQQYYETILWVDVNHNGAVDAFPADSGLLAKVMASTPGDFAPSNTVTVAKGATFNANLLALTGSWIHNPFYAEALALATISAVQSQYGVSAPPAVRQLMRERAAALGVHGILLE